MEDQDDLDILACLVDSDSESLNDEDLLSLDSTVQQETGTSNSSSPPLQSKNQHGGGHDHVNTTTALTMEEMAAKMANMEKYIQQLERRTSPPAAVSNGAASRLSDGEDDGQNKEFSKKTPPSSSSQNPGGLKQFSKDSSRIAHRPTNTCTVVQPELSTTSQSSTKRKANDYLESARKKAAGGLVTKTAKAPAESLGFRQKKPDKSLVPKNKKTEKPGLTDRQTADNDKDVTSDSFSGLRIISPSISSVVMEKRMEGRKLVKISQIPTKIKGKDIEGDWVTIGVIVQKLPPKQSSNGKTYGIWKLSDLGSSTTNEVVALFLFGDIYKEHWKTTEGSVVALLNASILPAREKNSHELALTLDNAKKLMLMGISKDLGQCKGTRGSDGQPCRNFVNKQHGEFCEYHIQTAYKKMRAQRMECQTSAGQAPLMKKFQKDLNSSTFMYQGRTVTASSQDAVNKKKNVTLKSLDKGNKTASKATTSNGDSSDKQEKKNNVKAEPSEFLLDLLSLPSVGTRNLVRHLNQDEELNKPEEERQPPMSASQLLKAHEKKPKKAKSSSTSTTTKPPQEASVSTPMLGRGLAPGSDIFFDESPGLKRRKTSDVDKAKLRALSLVKQKGPIGKDDPNAVRKKLSPKTQGEIERIVSEDSAKENLDENADQDSRKKRRRILGPEFGSIDLSSKEGRALMKAKSLHVGAVHAAEAEKEEQYFNELEKKEQLEDKMKTIMEIKVKVVCCKQCNYVAESASELCYKEKHTLKHAKSTKKFFACKECKQRTITYGAPIPKHPCKNCGASNYQRTSMYKEKVGPKIAGETLLVRGEEQAKFLNSAK